MLLAQKGEKKNKKEKGRRRKVQVKNQCRAIIVEKGVKHVNLKSSHHAIHEIGSQFADSVQQIAEPEMRRDSETQRANVFNVKTYIRWDAVRGRRSSCWLVGGQISDLASGEMGDEFAELVLARRNGAGNDECGILAFGVGVGVVQQLEDHGDVSWPIGVEGGGDRVSDKVSVQFGETEAREGRNEVAGCKDVEFCVEEDIWLLASRFSRIGGHAAKNRRR